MADKQQLSEYADALKNALGLFDDIGSLVDQFGLVKLDHGPPKTKISPNSPEFVSVRTGAFACVLLVAVRCGGTVRSSS